MCSDGAQAGAPAKPAKLDQKSTTAFKRMRIGGGGFVTDIDISPDGETRLIRTDVYGCYIWSVDQDPQGQWSQLVTKSSMLDGIPRFGESIGCYDVRCAPSSPTRIYMATATGHDKINPRRHAIFRSDDRGRTFRRTKAPEMLLNFQERLNGPKMAVHPHDPDVVLIGDARGVIFQTTNGGANWNRVADIPMGEAPTICFGPTGRTIYVSTGSNGIFASKDEGRHWSRIPGGPSKVTRMVCDARGRLWATEAKGGGRNAWRFRDGQWTRLSPAFGEGWHSVAVNPLDANQICLGYEAGNINLSYDGGDTWTGAYQAAPSRKHSDIPWLAWTSENWFSNANMAFDPVEPNRLWCAQGIGVWYTHPGRDASKPVWRELTRGNEELIVNRLIKPPGGDLIVSCQDRAFFVLTDADRYPATHGPANDTSIRHGWGLDYTTDDPSFIVGVAVEKSGVSTDGGRTWTPFASLPPDGMQWRGGEIAALSRTNFVWFPANNGAPHFTKDGGRTWARCKFAGAPAKMDEPGWSFSFYTNRHILCVERSTGHAYAYNYQTSSPDGDISGVWRSVDGGESWSRTGRGFGIPGAMGTGAKLAAVPGRPGHLFFAVGTADGVFPYGVTLRQTTDGGATWRQIPGFDENWSVGFGKAAPGRSYPAIFVAGARDRVPGIFRSDDSGETWSRLADDYGTLDGVRDITGDLDEYGTVHVGLSGSGVICGKLV